MSDAAIVRGIRALWENGSHIDCHIHIGENSFPVHKVVISSVSDHFNSLLSACDRKTVQLDEVSSPVMENLIDFIYKGTMAITNENVAELLDGAKHLEIQTAVDACVQFIMSNLDVKNCINMLSVFQKHSLDIYVKKVQSFIESNLPAAYKERNPKHISYDELCFVMDGWRDKEVNLFFFVKKWVEADLNSRKKRVNVLMDRIRFCLMTQGQLKQVQSTKMYRECFGTWRGVVDMAISYNQLPMHIKILNDSEQNTVRGKPGPTCFMDSTEAPWSKPCLYTLNRDLKWKTARIELPEDCHHVMASVVVNNFLIATPMDTGDEGREFYAFDPRTLEHSQLASLGMEKEDFPALVHHKESLFLIGGSKTPDKGTAEIYDIKANKWSHFVQLPYSVTRHAACVFNEAIYITGGEDPNGHKVVCLDLATKVCKGKAPMMNQHSMHQMCVMKLHGQEVICVLDDNFQLEYYSASINQWSVFTASFSHGLPSKCSADTMIIDGNMVLYYDDHGHRLHWINGGECLQLTYPDDGEQVAVEYLDEHFCPYPDDNDLGLYAHSAVLAIPAHKVSTPKCRKPKEPDSPPECYEDCFPERYDRRIYWY